MPKKPPKKPQKTGPKIGPDGPAVVIAASVPTALAKQLDQWRQARDLGRSAAVAEAIRRLVS